MGKKPRVITRCVANHYAMPNERIIEFTFPDGRGGLISFRSGGSNVIDIYRLDPGVVVLSP